MSQSSNPHLNHQLKIKSLSESVYLDYPLIIHLETLALCSAACNFCPYPTLSRKGERMNDSLIDKILSDLKDIPSEVSFQLAPFKVNEPFLDTRLIPLLKKVNQCLPNARLLLYSNGSPITEAKALELNKLENIVYLCISLNEYRPEVYTQVMHLPWERTWERLQMLHRLKAEGKLHFDIMLSRVGDSSQHDIHFVHWCVKNLPLFKSGFFSRGEWLNQVSNLEPSSQIVPDVGCVRWFELSITATGEVAFCCMDGQAEWVLGDVRKEHLLEIYNRPAFRRLREQQLSRLTTNPCRQCTYLTY